MCSKSALWLRVSFFILNSLTQNKIFFYTIESEPLYNHIWKDKRQGGQLYRELRHRGKKYNKQRKGTSGRGNIPGRIDIKQRPCIVEKKTRLGDWELDTVIGARHKGVIVSMVERTSKLN
ncbi:hypothetical protein RHABOEDO_001698 [Candidatus Rhabdochlamydia oedothoracis]|uniref:Transposase n=1 Tax=Candidatus Rhabdochlamydia oedothoracis TaxID=2720720 RepID=A0ABX8V2F3_9BACT|nr:IS30 family transposase [Candidatus Rhabdochlamydia oedothoracis]QYF49369.1 hypothetical protein RHABOEDO_001698 [Candidatus Rhabdochlamydia oedothoracis]